MFSFDTILAVTAPNCTNRNVKGNFWTFTHCEIIIVSHCVKVFTPCTYQLSYYLDVNNILSDNQYGFRKERSTNLAIFDVLKNLHENWNENNFSGCTFIDFSRAFDSIDHNILANKLQLYGFDEISLKFMESYMSKRVQKTVVNGHASTPAQVTYGTAQGSILGPLLFILYVNDVFKSLSPNLAVYMYADDTLLVSKANSMSLVVEKVQKALDEMVQWCGENKLSINRGKTKFMLIKHTKIAGEAQINRKLQNRYRKYIRIPWYCTG